MSLYHIPLAPISHPRLDLFLLGYIAAVSIFVALFFLRFWKQTRDFLFMAFAVFFAIEGAIPALGLSTPNPNLAVGWKYVLHLLAVILILFAILRKNFRTS